VADKIGAGWPPGTVFQSRQAVGYTWRGKPEAKITSRILWLEGLQFGFNRGNGCDSLTRFIYIHGTGNETLLGQPDSCGCVHLAAKDLLPLFERVSTGTLVWIARDR
jgi:lipoprotein-anchoring transpeptidase ErfK/SrfK